MLYFDTLQIGRPFLHKAGSHDSCCSNLNQKSMICANIFNWQSIALGKKLNNCALWTIFLWIHNKKLPFTLLLLMDHSGVNCFSFEILAHCVQPSSNYVFDENIKFFYFREGTSFFLCLMKIISFNSLHSEIITYINSSLQKWKRNFIIFATLYQIHYNDGVLSLKSDKIVLADRQF